MSLNVTINGFCYLDDTSISNSNVYYQMLWFPNGTASSTTTWNNVRIVESSGYFSANLGDADFLSQEGTALTTGIILVVFWRGSTLDRNSLCSGANRIEEWGCTEFIHAGHSTYTLATQVKSNLTPILNWDLPVTGFVGDSYDTTNNSYDNHSWQFNGVEMQHIRSKYGEDIQLINTITDSSYDWGDGSVDLNLPGTSDASHIWNTAGSYDIQLTVVDECSGLAADIKSIDVSNKAPVPNIACIQAVGNTIDTPDTVVTFQYTGTDPNNKITSIDWEINDVGAYGTTNTFSTASRDDIVSHTNGTGTSWCSHSATLGAFTNPGFHNVSIVIHWNDGFNDLSIYYNEDFEQTLFTSPVPDFTQDPPQATLSGVVNFTNSSSSVGSVGTGLPGCTRYDWEFIDDVVQNTTSDVDYAYIYTITPLSTTSQIELCANWYDGWQNHVACIDKDIVFATTVTVTPEDCYYNLDIAGTSSDGSISGYSWEIYRDTTISGGTGPWELIWESPVGIDQKIKQVGFTEVGYFKVVGYIYGGGTTNDDELLYIHEVCPSSAYHAIWDGTGELDNGSDWDRFGFGFESVLSVHAGTNGLDATGMVDSNFVMFNKTLSAVDINDYESINMWMNIQEHSAVSDIIITLGKLGETQSKDLKLSNYINVYELNKWQKVFINLEDFNLSPSETLGHPTYVNSLKLTSVGNIGFYLDDAVFSAGRLERTAVAVCTVDINAKGFGNRKVASHTMKPSVRGKEANPFSGRMDIRPFPKPKIT